MATPVKAFIRECFGTLFEKRLYASVLVRFLKSVYTRVFWYAF